ncbi:nuclease sbcCD subunit C [Reticulomyxa filosa]|uniref:Nuclease sbcCD subunit C n=1 Tax=Reticulomyxa filosa TaxID=46433 RepID=X6M2J1_RETFI|nr:nuclease sbcCD subunit C [Reticulomyxa filosa]|eukprot:ETO08109.1 nuclease sbcCD subunit C [Reticulomyxa filosa]
MIKNDTYEFESDFAKTFVNALDIIKDMTSEFHCYPYQQSLASNIEYLSKDITMTRIMMSFLSNLSFRLMEFAPATNPKGKSLFKTVKIYVTEYVGILKNLRDSITDCNKNSKNMFSFQSPVESFNNSVEMLKIFYNKRKPFLIKMRNNYNEKYKMMSNFLLPANISGILENLETSEKKYFEMQSEYTKKEEEMNKEIETKKDIFDEIIYKLNEEIDKLQKNLEELQNQNQERWQWQTIKLMLNILNKGKKVYKSNYKYWQMKYKMNTKMKNQQLKMQLLNLNKQKEKDNNNYKTIWILVKRNHDNITSLKKKLLQYERK